MDLTDAEALARGRMKEHGVDEDWTFAWSRSIINFGMTKTQWRRGVYHNEILLSKPLTEVMPSRAVDNIILHEIAHALVGLHHNHDRVWREKHLALGGNGDAKEGDLTWSAMVAPYIYVCRVGGETVDVSTRRLSTVGKMCRAHKADIDRYRFDDSHTLRVPDADVVRHSEN